MGISIRFSEEQTAQIAEQAKNEGISKSALVRKAVNAYFLQGLTLQQEIRGIISEEIAKAFKSLPKSPRLRR